MDKVRSGFTLIEVLIVIGILLIITTVFLTAMNPVAQLQKSRDARRKSDLAQIKRALLMYYNDELSFPDELPAAGSSFTGTDATMVYMKSVPGDPLADGDSYSYSLESANEFCLKTSLERENDPDILESQSRCSDCPISEGEGGKGEYVVCPD